MLTTIFTNILQVSLTTGAVVLLLLLFSARLNRRFVVKWKYWVWLVLAVRLLVPAPFSIPRAPVQIAVPDMPVVQSQPLPVQPQPAASAPAVVPPTGPAAVVPSASSSLTLLDVLAYAWLAGVLLFALYHGISYLWCRRQCLRWSRPVSSLQARQLLDGLCRDMAVAKAPALLVSEKVSSPMMIGFFRSYLLLPPVDYAPADLAFILRHELVHRKRGDVWYKLALLAANALHWFNPVMYLMFRDAAKDLELACDDEVVRDLGLDEKRQYSETILRSMHRQRRQAALTTYFHGGSKSVKERLANILGKNKRRSGFLLGGVVLVCAIGVGSVVALQTGGDIDPGEYDDLYDRYLLSLHVGMIANSQWDDANQVPPHYYTYYYASEVIKEGGTFGEHEIVDEFYMLIPTDELEPYVQQHFDVTTEHLRSADTYTEEHNGYRFGGLGSAVDFVITSAYRKGGNLYLAYDVIGGPGYRYGYGEVAIRVRGADYRYLSNRYQWSAEYYLAFPSALDVVAENGVMVMDSGGWSAIGSEDGQKEYNGEQLDSIVAFYLEEALVSLEASGAPDAQQPEDGWRWSGTYRDGLPLTIEVAHKYGASSYIITATYQENAGSVSSPVGEIDLDQPDSLYAEYFGQAFYSGMLDSTWEVPFNIQDTSSFVRFYASRTNQYDGELRFSTGEVDPFLQEFFLDLEPDVIRYSIWYDEATDTYFSDRGFDEDRPDARIVEAVLDGDNLILSYEVFPPEQEDRLLWEGELTVVLSDSGFQYASNRMRYPLFPITQDADVLAEATGIYVLPLIPSYGILFQSWATAQEIPADSLINFCAYNNLLGKPVLPDSDPNRRGAELADQRGEAVEVEAAVQRYFDVPAEYLRTSSLYNYRDESTGEQYTDAYLLLNGFGGGAWTEALHTEQEGDLVHITVGLYGPDDTADRPAGTSLLTVRLGENGTFQYVSNLIQ